MLRHFDCAYLVSEHGEGLLLELLKLNNVGKHFCNRLNVSANDQNISILASPADIPISFCAYRFSVISQK
jgi:hypothetical protein